MTVTDPNDSMLDDLFAEARSLTPAPSAALMARVLSDAAVVQPVPTDPDRPSLGAPVGYRGGLACGQWPCGCNCRRDLGWCGPSVISRRSDGKLVG